MAVIAAIPSTLYAADTRTLTSGNLNPAFTVLKATLTRESWPATARVNATVDLSLDAGQSWNKLGGFSAVGGDHIRRDSTIATETTFAMPVPDAGNSQRRLRLTVANSETLRTAITLEAI